MVRLALGSIADWNGLPGRVQALFSARYDNLFAAWEYLDTIDNPLPDSYGLVYIGSVTEDDAWPGTAVNMRTGLTNHIDITALNMTTIKPLISTAIKFEMAMLPGSVGGNLRIHDIHYDVGITSGSALRFRNGGNDTVNLELYNLKMIGRSGATTRVFIDLDSASDGHRMYINMYNLIMARAYIGIRVSYPAMTEWTPRTIIENCSLDMRTVGYRGISTVATVANTSWQYTLKNIDIFGSSGGVSPGDYVPNPNSPDPPTYNCADGDDSIASNISSAVNCVPNITAADEFLSLTYADADYLDLKKTGETANGGAGPSISANFRGISGRPRPHTVYGLGAKYSIGAYELRSDRGELRHEVAMRKLFPVKILLHEDSEVNLT